MEQLQLLWEYQELDLLMDQQKRERKNSKLRHKLLKLKNRLIRLQKKLVAMDEEADNKSHMFDKINDEYSSIVKVLDEGREKLKAISLSEKDSLDELKDEGAKLLEDIAKKEEELKRFIKEIENLQKKVIDIGQDITETKKEYAEAKKIYDEEMKEFKAEYQKLKEKRDAVAKKVDKTLMTKYKNLKPSHSPVVSLVSDHRCAGCNMGLAALVMQKVKDKKSIIECENCGRFLYHNE